MVAALGGVAARALGAGGERNGPASAPTAEGRAGRPRARAGALAARRSAARRSATAPPRGATASERAAAPGARPRGLGAAPRRRGAAPRRPRAPHLVVREKAFRRGRGLPSPLTVLEQPPAFAEELPHHGGRARPRVVVRGAAARLSPRGDDGGTGRAGCPRGLGVPRRPGLHARLRGRVGRKTRCFFTDFAFDDQVLRRGRLPHLARDRHQLADAAHQARFTTRTGACSRSARRSRNSSDHKVASCCSAPRNARCARARARSPRS